uniref:Saposin B-type domain-containing protein n=1 Tax=Chromera velia CCMP2878 TaxID=1169474 RepID=A0A0G4I689_9ALVE|eukprot:Cvel_11341.t1-p1 / transcript=Cvel_11341.t1 / gene=Cvel_11341 / organism=Chromera_velia_CCMP2878 / gene_product=hypothetical protein / transcript_product=hypothetical protein / location=Cvel_scaffold710:31469-36478(+) / protein_length=229 / sequence_SO=supercontig / SO=protein_coding / is_pseudo=false
MRPSTARLLHLLVVGIVSCCASAKQHTLLSDASACRKNFEDICYDNSFPGFAPEDLEVQKLYHAIRHDLKSWQNMYESISASRDPLVVCQKMVNSSGKPYCSTSTSSIKKAIFGTSQSCRACQKMAEELKTKLMVIERFGRIDRKDEDFVQRGSCNPVSAFRSGRFLVLDLTCTGNHRSSEHPMGRSAMSAFAKWGRGMEGSSRLPKSSDGWRDSRSNEMVERSTSWSS